MAFFFLETHTIPPFPQKHTRTRYLSSCKPAGPRRPSHTAELQRVIPLYLKFSDVSQTGNGNI